MSIKCDICPYEADFFIGVAIENPLYVRTDHYARCEQHARYFQYPKGIYWSPHSLSREQYLLDITRDIMEEDE